MNQTKPINLTNTVSLSIGLAVFVMLLVWLPSFFPSHVHAQNQMPVRVDQAGQCNGMSPCYTTIQTGVNNTAPGQAVLIFPGVYTESVDLALMGSALITPTLGDITLATVDANGSVVTGTATISPTRITGMRAARTRRITNAVCFFMRLPLRRQAS